MEVSEITLYNTLKQSLGEEQAQIVVEGMKTQVREALENSKSVLATKEDLFGLRSELKEDINNLRSELKKDINNLRSELKEDINGLRVEMKVEIASVRADTAALEIKMEKMRADLIKWMFIFWVSQLAAVFGLLRFFL